MLPDCMEYAYFGSVIWSYNTATYMFQLNVQNAATKTNNGNTIALWFLLLVRINENIFYYASAVIYFAVNLHVII